MTSCNLRECLLGGRSFGLVGGEDAVRFYNITSSVMHQGGLTQNDIVCDDRQAYGRGARIILSDAHGGGQVTIATSLPDRDGELRHRVQSRELETNNVCEFGLERQSSCQRLGDALSLSFPFAGFKVTLQGSTTTSTSAIKLVATAVAMEELVISLDKLKV